MHAAVDAPSLSHDARLATYSTVSTALDLHSDRGLRELVDTAEPLGLVGGGRPARLEVSGTPVFVKRVPLTEMERLPEHTRSTANVFDSPPTATTASALPVSGCGGRSPPTP